MRRQSFVLVAAALLLDSAPALAMGKSASEASDASPADRQGREREARGACLNGDWARGVALLSELFLDFKDPNYIFNQGRCYEQNQRFQEAIGRFREYLRTGTEDKAAAEKHIAECEALLRQTRPSRPAPAVGPAPPSPVAAPALRPEVAAEVKPPPAKPPGSRLPIAGAVVFGVGAVGLVTGLVLNLKANRLADTIEPPAYFFDRSTESTRKSYETFAWVGYGVGAAGLVTGAILFGIGWRQAGRAEALALVPTIGTDLAGASLQGTF
jgi:hypothetical protein